MITTIHCQLSDLMVDLYRHVSLTRDDAAIHSDLSSDTWELRFLDIPTGNSFTLSIPSESDAVKLFAAWLMADKPSDIIDAVHRLYRLIPQHLHKVFLP